MKLIIGLGNPGTRYERTRHNVGFRVCDELLRRSDAPDEAWKTKYQGQFVKTHLAGDGVILLKPQTMMNASDEAVLRFKKWFRIPLADCWIVLDDIDLPLGTIRIRAEGSSAGHKGLEAILTRLGSMAIPRFRVGVRGATPIRDAADYVLKPFAKVEEPMIDEAIIQTADAIEHGVTGGLRGAQASATDNKVAHSAADKGQE